MLFRNLATSLMVGYIRPEPAKGILVENSEVENGQLWPRPKSVLHWIHCFRATTRKCRKLLIREQWNVGVSNILSRYQELDVWHMFDPIFGFCGKVFDAAYASKLSRERDYFRWRLSQIARPETVKSRLLRNMDDYPRTIRIYDGLGTQQCGIGTLLSGIGCASGLNHRILEA